MSALSIWMLYSTDISSVTYLVLIQSPVCSLTCVFTYQWSLNVCSHLSHQYSYFCLRVGEVNISRRMFLPSSQPWDYIRRVETENMICSNINLLDTTHSIFYLFETMPLCSLTCVFTYQWLLTICLHLSHKSFFP